MMFAGLGFTAAATAWADSATAAWNFANPIHVDDAGQFDAFYGPLMAFTTWTTGQKADVKNFMRTHPVAHVARTFAAAGMFRLTGNSTYGDIATAPHYPIPTLDLGGEAIYAVQEYTLAAAANPTIKAAFKTMLVDAAFGTIGPVIGSEADCSFRRIRRKGANALVWGHQGTALNVEGPALIRAWFHTTDPAIKARCLAAGQAGVNWIDGANLNGFAYTSGIGTRSVDATLDVDHRNGPPLAQQPIGKTVYGHGGVGGPAFPTFIDQFGFGASSGIVEMPRADFDANAPHEQREWFPWRLTQAPLEFIPQNYWCISVMEYTVSQTIDPLFAVCAWLQGHDGTGTEL